MAKVLLERLEDWEERLLALITERQRQPYRYGYSDCYCLMRDSVREVTGVLLFPEIDPPKNVMSAMRTMIARGWETIEDLMIEGVGEPVKNLSETRTGDVVSFWRVGELHLAVRVGDSAVSPGDRGLVAIDRGDWSKGWRIGS